MISLINQTKLKGDSVGGEITALVTNVLLDLESLSITNWMQFGKSYVVN